MLTSPFSHMKPGLHISRKDRKHMVANKFFKAFQVCLGLHMVVMIAGIHISHEIFANDISTTSSENDCKHVLRLLRLYGDEV